MQKTVASPWLEFSCNERIGARQVQHRLSLASPWTCIFGASGSGKTTLLRLIAGLLSQSEGTCKVHGRELRGIPAHRRRIALVDPSGSLFPHLTVRQNVGFASRYSRADVDLALERFRLTHVADANVHRLSGGESQRAALARALLSQPDALLLDESISGLDLQLRQQLRSILLETQTARAAAQQPMPILSVTHDVAEVFATADEVLRMHDGRLVARGSAAEVLAQERMDLLGRLSDADTQPGANG